MQSETLIRSLSEIRQIYDEKIITLGSLKHNLGLDENENAAIDEINLEAYNAVETTVLHDVILSSINNVKALAIPTDDFTLGDHDVTIQDYDVKRCVKIGLGYALAGNVARTSEHWNNMIYKINYDVRKKVGLAVCREEDIFKVCFTKAFQQHIVHLIFITYCIKYPEKYENLNPETILSIESDHYIDYIPIIQSFEYSYYY